MELGPMLVHQVPCRSTGCKQHPEPSPLILHKVSLLCPEKRELLNRAGFG